jgi:uncharacterized glyoxalase superfamily metalloenzyme YdcJ
MSHPKKLATWQLRAQFVVGLSAMYAGEVPAYATLVDVLDHDSTGRDVADDSGYDIGWPAGAIGRDIHDPYALYEALSQEAPT